MPPTAECGCRNQGRRSWRERPGRARVQWPRACPEGRSRHGCQCPVSIVRVSVAAQEAPMNQADMCATNRTRLSGRSGPVCPGRSGEQRRLVLDARQARCCRRLNADSRPTPCPRPRAQDDNERNRRRCAGHHAIDAHSVLGTVQGSALRFDRAPARPSGLDGACAQTAVLAIARWPMCR